MLVDSHCHLNFDSFNEDRAAVIERAREAGVEFILNPGVDLASSREAVDLASHYPQVYAAVGVHPNDSLSWTTGTADAIRELATHSKVSAIGEIGLDYYRDRAPHEVQQRVFERQLWLASELGLPVVIHNREATEDVLGMLEEWQRGLAAANSRLAERPGVLHSYSGDEVAALRAIDANFYLGITGPVTFRNAPELQRIVTQLPLDHILIETDAPFLTPHPHRGKRNEPAYVRFIANKIAELHNLPADFVADATTRNAKRLFNWRASS